MGVEIFQRSVRIERPAAEVFAWHERPGAFARLCPPWERVEVLAHVGGIRDGARVSLRTRVGPAWSRWEIVHRDYVAGRQFRDVLLRGPFAQWEHLHLVEPAGDNACVLTDEIRYRLPLGALGRLAGGAFTRRQLARMFDYRHAVTKADLEGVSAGPRQCVLVSGASGLVGGVLTAFLQTQGHTVRRLVRGAARSSDEFRWDPASGELDPAALRGVEAVVHLAGENVAGGRWTAARQAKIMGSRVDGTRALVRAIAACVPTARPAVLVSASAVGFYGHRGDEQMAEDAGRGVGFLADVCEAWESEVTAVESLGVRAVMLRTGVVLTPAGGALAKMLPAFRCGVAGRLGSGQQWLSWITPDDLASMYERAIFDPAWRGAINAVAPEPVTNSEFTATLARVLRRPAILPVPAVALKMVFGRMAEATLLASTRAVPERAQALGFVWRQPDLELALRNVLGK
jgi:uncharacterized protein (TIGR01777 family)